MKITSVIEDQLAWDEKAHQGEPIVLSTRIRLARNIVNTPFPGWANTVQRKGLEEKVSKVLSGLEFMSEASHFAISDLSELERHVLIERHLISRELTEASEGASFWVSKDQGLVVMVNEEDHMRIQSVAMGFNFESTWKTINAFDDAIEACLDYAFSSEIGYLTACPTNLGTAMRASAMLHLPGLVMQEHMDKVVRMVNQLGLTVRGLFGEGSEATGSIFQISNQQTLGEDEESIIKRLVGVLEAIIEQEAHAREKLLEESPALIYDKIGRAYGILKNAHVISSEEAMSLLSLLRLAVDLGMLPEESRNQVDRHFIEMQPGHIQYTAQTEIEPGERDLYRAKQLRTAFADLADLSLKNGEKSA